MIVSIKMALLFGLTYANFGWMGSRDVETKVSDQTKKVAMMSLEENPAYADAISNEMIVARSILALINPKIVFERELPPGTAQLMLQQILNKGTSTVFPLLLCKLIELFPGFTSDDQERINKNKCVGGKDANGKKSKKCPTGYDKVTLPPKLIKDKIKLICDSIKNSFKNSNSNNNQRSNPSTDEKPAGNDQSNGSSPKEQVGEPEAREADQEGGAANSVN